jgi:uncharacterized protein YyaL (SSP411 family)
MGADPEGRRPICPRRLKSATTLRLLSGIPAGSLARFAREPPLPGLLPPRRRGGEGEDFANLELLRGCCGRGGWIFRVLRSLARSPDAARLGGLNHDWPQRRARRLDWIVAQTVLVIACAPHGAFDVSASTAPTNTERRTNRLAREKSPYLLQHQHNPVDWHAWGPEAFERARSENKPIFLSIGYSTCHWCHVMERESFEDEATAKVLNENFISIKVDREERPDVDKIYMTYVQARTGSGGWPLNVFLTPDLKPFYGGTYWPPSGRHGRPGFADVLRELANLWKNRRGEVVDAANDMTERLRAFAEQDGPASDGLPSKAGLEHAAAVLKSDYDPEHGGFGGAPKFPRPSHPLFLLEHGQRTGDLDAVRMVLHTCERMAAGGIRDQLGGGFARYSVDAQWLAPHFEKMLYDNAQLAQLYLDAHLASGEARFADVVRSTLDYVLRDMTDPDGGFYSAEDADSEGHEGKFYCWTRSELRELLAPEEFEIVARRFGITEQGNFVDHSRPDPLPNQNVLSIVDDQLKPGEASLLRAAEAKMLAAREKRARPHRDDKILTSWNGLMIGAMARAGAALAEPRFIEAAERALDFIRKRLWTPGEGGGPGTLRHRWRDGESDSAQLLDDYAFLLDGALHVYEATLAPERLEFALAVAEAMRARFEDAERGGFWQSGSGADLIMRVKEDYDGAEPSGNSVAALALLRLAAITEREEFRVSAERVLRLYTERMMKLPQAMPHMLLAAAFALEAPRRVVIATAGEPQVEGKALIQAAHSVYQSRKVVMGTRGPVDPFARGLKPADGGATAHVCSGTSCQPPTQDPAALDQSDRPPSNPASAA